MSGRRVAWIGAALALGLAAAPGCGGGDDGGPAETCTVAGGAPGFDAAGPLCTKLSSYQLFDDIAAQAPADGVVPYDLNTPLFSDYATKYRFLYVPDGQTMAWDDVESFDLPVGAILVKTFAFLADRREPDGARDLIETRLMIHRADGWEPAAYLYDPDDQDATLAIAGATVDVAWIHDDGSPRTDAYGVPNKNQCKNCHEEHDDIVGPLGPKARHLNRPGPDGSGIDDQLAHLIDLGVLAGAPADPTTWPRAAVFDDPSTGTVEARARAWLDINCSHCHNPRGAARTSGLDLSLGQTDPYEYGVCKAPVAAGTGSGDRPYGIVPGDPDQSILVYRIESTDPAVRMPELGRNLVHEEGVAVIREWISSMSGGCATVAPPAR